MPWRMAPPVAAALAALAFATPSAQARHPRVEDWETDIWQEYERDERATVRDATHGWTWAAMPKVAYEDYRDNPHHDERNPRRRLVRVTALAATASGDAIVGGAVRGPIRLGATSVGMTQGPRGFIGRVDH